jgi:hypothetical protein
MRRFSVPGRAIITAKLGRLRVWVQIGHCSSGLSEFGMREEYVRIVDVKMKFVNTIKLITAKANLYSLFDNF